MPRFPRITGNQMIRYLQKQGFVIVHRSGSHVTLGREGIFTVVPAGNGRMKIGTQHSALAYADISKEKFVKDCNAGRV